MTKDKYVCFYESGQGAVESTNCYRSDWPGKIIKNPDVDHLREAGVPPIYWKLTDKGGIAEMSLLEKSAINAELDREAPKPKNRPYSEKYISRLMTSLIRAFHKQGPLR